MLIPPVETSNKQLEISTTICKRNTDNKTPLMMSFWYLYNVSKGDVVVELSSLTENIYCSGIKSQQINP